MVANKFRYADDAPKIAAKDKQRRGGKNFTLCLSLGASVSVKDIQILFMLSVHNLAD